MDKPTSGEVVAGGDNTEHGVHSTQRHLRACANLSDLHVLCKSRLETADRRP